MSFKFFVSVTTLACWLIKLIQSSPYFLLLELVRHGPSSQSNVDYYRILAFHKSKNSHTKKTTHVNSNGFAELVSFLGYCQRPDEARYYGLAKCWQ